MTRAAIVGLAGWISALQAASLSETAIFSAFKQADPTLSHTILLQRTAVTEELDLIVAMGGRTEFLTEFARVSWNKDRKIGLFLQEKSRPGRVYLLDIKSGFPDCSARVERVTATDTVISCRAEQSAQPPNQKWVYDVRAKNLVRQFSYLPFAMERLFSKTASASSPDGAVFIGINGQKLVAVEYAPDQDSKFRILNGAAAQPWTRRVHIYATADGVVQRTGIALKPEQLPAPVGIPQLPRTTYDQFAAARPLRVKDGYVREGTELNEAVGPWKRENEAIWFGKSFYDSEGSTGVGGFGYFDKEEKKLRMFAPPEIVDWSVSAIEVTPHAVWMALVHNGEYGGSSGGLLRYDRQTNEARRYPLLDIAFHIIDVNGVLLAATDFGIDVVDGNRITRFFVDQTTDGRLRIAAATR